MHFLTSKI